MQTIDELKNIHKDIVNDFEDIANDLPVLLRSSYGYTSEICFMYINSTLLIFEAILNAINSENYYSINILYRSLIEHFLRFNFYFFNFALNGKSDSYSHKFRTALEFNDKFLILKSKNSIETNLKIKKNAQDIKDELYRSNSNYEKYDLQELDTIARDLSIKNIINFTEKHIDNKEFDSEGLLKEIIVQYSKLSSYVHGGILAHREHIYFATENKIIKNMTVILGSSIITLTSIKLQTLMILSETNPEYLKVYFKISSNIYKLQSVKKDSPTL